MSTPVEYDDRTALVVVDMQNDFADPQGSLHVQGGDKIVPFVNQEIARARERGALIVYTRDWHPPDTPHFAIHGGKWPVHCVRDTWGAEFHPEVDVVTDHHTHKGTGHEDGYSAFTVEHVVTGERSGTGLEELLREHGVERIVVIGLATDYCVKETGLDGITKGFDVTVLLGGVRAVDLEPGDGDQALRDLEEAGAALV